MISTKTYQNVFLLNHRVISKKAGHNVLFNNVTASYMWGLWGLIVPKDSCLSVILEVYTFLQVSLSFRN